MFPLCVIGILDAFALLRLLLLLLLVCAESSRISSVKLFFFFCNAILFLSVLLPFGLCRFESIGRNQSLTFVEEFAVLGF